MLNLAVSATAITAIIPACTRSATTRSAASGTLPAMFRLTTSRPCLRTSRTARSISPPMSEPASTSARARGSPAPAHVVAVGLGDGADRDLTDLGAAAHDDDALAVDHLQRLHELHIAHDRQ